MPKEKRYLRDDVANIILTDSYTREFTENIVIKATGLPKDVVKNNLTLLTPRVNSNVNTEYSYVDAIYENNTAIINIEVNYSRQAKNNFKNMKYVCQLLLRQTTVGDEKIELKPIYQININGYDVFNEGKFIYKSVLMEENIHKKRNDFLTIIDINVDFLTNIDYNKIIKEEEDSLEKILYIFVCENKNILDKLYSENEIMEKVREKLSALTEDFDKELYYNREEYINELSYAEGMEDGITKGIEQGITQEKRAIAASMLKDNVPIETIVKYIGLTKEELESLKNINN